MSDEFRVDRDGTLAVITLDHPKVGNALSGNAAAALADTFDEISTGEGGVRAVLLRAEGKHFCTGAQLSGNGAAGEKPVTGHMVRSMARTHHRAVAAVFECRIPVVAAVQGTAQGFGLHLALATDFIVAASDATFAAPFADRGFSVDSGGSWLLPRLVGLTRAKQMIYFSEQVEAGTALDWHLVHQVVPGDVLDSTARALANRLTTRPTQAIAASKLLLQHSSSVDLRRAMHDESMAVELTIRSNDFREGMQAFGQKRPPEFGGS